MKLVTKVTAIFVAAASLALLASCGSTSSKAAKEPEIPPAPVPATEAPKYTFSGNELKIETENMFSDGSVFVVQDAKASGYYCIKLLNEESFCEAIVTFPAGSYQLMANEDAPDGAHDAFNIFVNDKAYRTFPSDPPLGTWELTTRSAKIITFDAETTCKVRIQQNDPNKPNKPGENGMKIDYLVFIKQ